MIRAWKNYDLTKAAAFMRRYGWNLRCHVVIIGPLGLCVLWRKKTKGKE